MLNFVQFLLALKTIFDNSSNPNDFKHCAVIGLGWLRSRLEPVIHGVCH